MIDLRFPLKDQLQDPVDEAALHRIAQRIDSRANRGKHRRLLPLVLGGVTAVGVVIATTSRIHHDAGPLTLADGREFVAASSDSSTSDIRLSDGSSIRLSHGAHIDPLESSGTTFSAIVTQGRADFDVRPGGPRHWVVECGLATIEVVGTAFACDREPGRLRVEVSHGVVLVRGERVPNRVRRLSAGETLDVVEETPRPASVANVSLTASASLDTAGSASPVAPETPAGLENREDGNSRDHVAMAQTWWELARHGHNDEAYATLGAEGLRSESRRLGVNDLLALADVARLSGHPAEAVVPLQRILSEFASNAQAPLAAFALGRLELDSLGHARAAVAAFRKALALGIPQGLREDVLARLVESYAKSGDTAGAQRAAQAYLDEFPNGRHVRAVQGWRQSQP
jgi:transmembrane sensor